MVWMRSSGIETDARSASYRASSFGTERQPTCRRSFIADTHLPVSGSESAEAAAERGWVCPRELRNRQRGVLVQASVMRGLYRARSVSMFERGRTYPREVGAGCSLLREVAACCSLVFARGRRRLLTRLRVSPAMLPRPYVRAWP